MSELGLDQYEQTLWGSASSGTKQKFGIAQALSIEADLYFLDEPFAHVDVNAVKKISGFINEKLNQQAAVVITTHLNKNSLFNITNHYFIEDGLIKSFW